MSPLTSLARLIVFFGLLMAAVGVIILLADKIPWLGKLPGDIYIQRKNFSFYLPITTCIIISIVLSLIFYFVGKR